MYEEENRYRFVPVTYALLAANLLAFIVLEISGSTNDTLFMMEHGALYAPLVLENGEYYRLFTAMFLHFGAVHLANNMLMLYLVGERLERAAGHVRFAVIYLLSGIGANLFTVFLYTAMGINAVSAGASGAIMGMIGAMFGWAVRGRGRVEGMGRRQILILAVFTLYSGFVSSSTNNAAHISGMLFGFLLGLILYRRGSRRRP